MGLIPGIGELGIIGGPNVNTYQIEACEDLYNKIDSALSILEPFGNDLKKEIDGLVSDSYNFIDEATDPMRNLADEIKGELDGLSDLLGGLSNSSFSISKCMTCIGSEGIPSSSKLSAFTKRVSGLGKDISDLGDDGVAFIYQLTQVPTDLTTQCYKIANKFANKLKTLPETAFALGLGLAMAKMPGLSSLMEQVDCWLNCIGQACPDVAERVDGLISRAQSVRDNIKMKEDGTLDTDTIMSDCKDSFKEWTNGVTDTIVAYKEQTKIIAASVVKTITHRKESHKEDEYGAKTGTAERQGTVRRKEFNEEYGWPSGGDGGYKYTTEIKSSVMNKLIDTLEGLGKNAKDELFIAISGPGVACWDSSDDLSEDGFKKYFEYQFEKAAPAVPTGKGDYKVEITINSLTAHGLQQNKKTEMYFENITASSMIQMTDETGSKQIQNKRQFATLRDTDFNTTKLIAAEKLKWTGLQWVNFIKDMTVPDDISTVQLFVKASLLAVRDSIRESASKFRL